jgi:uroporphyrinogen-III synthase
VPDPTARPFAASSLAGKRIVVTRAAAQSSEIFEKLLQKQAIPISLPLVSFSGPQDYAPLDAALHRWQEFDWVLFTSANAVQSVLARRAASNVPTQQISTRPRIAVVGPATKDEVTRGGLSVERVAKTHLGLALAEELAPELSGKHVFLPRSDRANPELPAALKKLGAILTEVVAYRTLPPGDVDRDRVTKTICAQADAVLFFSPSAVHNLAGLIGKEPFLDLQKEVAIAAVGPVTAAALRDYGMLRIVVAADTTAEAVVDALEAQFSRAITNVAAPQSIAGVKHG